MIGLLGWGVINKGIGAQLLLKPSAWEGLRRERVNGWLSLSLSIRIKQILWNEITILDLDYWSRYEEWDLWCMRVHKGQIYSASQLGKGRPHRCDVYKTIPFTLVYFFLFFSLFAPIYLSFSQLLLPLVALCSSPLPSKPPHSSIFRLNFNRKIQTFKHIISKTFNLAQKPSHPHEP